MSKVINVESQDEFDEVTSNGVSMVDLWAPWCGPCRMIAPVIEELADDFDGKADICKINTDENQELCTKLRVRSIPTILFIKDGEVVKTVLGAKSKSEFTEILKSVLKA